MVSIIKLSSVQKKILGLVIIIILSLPLLLFSVVTIVNLIRDEFMLAFYVLGMVILISFPVMYGFKLYRQGKSELLRLKEPISTNALLIIEGVLLKNEYINLYFGKRFQSPLVLYFHFIFLLTLITNPVIPDLQHVHIRHIFLLMPLVYPFMIYYQAVKNYNSNPVLNEGVTFEITIDSIFVKGDSFNTSIRWNSLHKVMETQKRFLVYTDYLNFIPIAKSGFKSQDDVQLMRNFIIHSSVPNKEIKN